MTDITRTIREQVTERIREDVLSGSYDPGQALRETEFAKRYGVSRGPVRDAFLQLSQEGFLSYEANRGVTVKEPPIEGNRDFIVTLRKQVETFVVNRGLDLVKDSHVRQLEVVVQELKANCEAKDIAKVAKSDMKFHETILSACGGEDFLTIWRWLCSQMMLTYSRLEDYLDIHAEHVRIYEALAQRDKTSLLVALESNIK